MNRRKGSLDTLHNGQCIPVITGNNFSYPKPSCLIADAKFKLYNDLTAVLHFYSRMLAIKFKLDFKSQYPFEHVNFKS